MHGDHHRAAAAGGRDTRSAFRPETEAAGTHLLHKGGADDPRDDARRQVPGGGFALDANACGKANRPMSPGRALQALTPTSTIASRWPPTISPSAEALSPGTSWITGSLRKEFIASDDAARTGRGLNRLHPAPGLSGPPKQWARPRCDEQRWRNRLFLSRHRLSTARRTTASRKHAGIAKRVRMPEAGREQPSTMPGHGNASRPSEGLRQPGRRYREGLTEWFVANRDPNPAVRRSCRGADRETPAGVCREGQAFPEQPLPDGRSGELVEAAREGAPAHQAAAARLSSVWPGPDGRAPSP